MTGFRFFEAPEIQRRSLSISKRSSPVDNFAFLLSDNHLGHGRGPRVSTFYPVPSGRCPPASLT